MSEAATGAMIGAIYDAALDPGQWPDVVSALTTWMGGVIGGLQVRRLRPSLSMTMVTAGLDPSFERAYREHYYQCDPHLAQVARLVPGQTLLSREVLADEELFSTPFFNEFCRPQDLCDLQGAVLLRNDSRVVTFAAYSSAGRRFDELTRARLDAVVPHLARSLNVSLLTEKLGAASTALSAAAAAQRAGVLRVDGALRVLSASDGVFGWLSEGTGALAIGDGYLRLRDRRDDAAVRSAVRSVCLGTPVTLELRAGAGPAVTLVSSAAPPSLGEAEPGALLLISSGAPRQNDSVSHDSGLPPSLRPVALALARGLSDKEIAGELDIPLATARTYVARVLRKRGARSRRELLIGSR